jgi:hypothetical protein
MSKATMSCFVAAALLFAPAANAGAATAVSSNWSGYVVMPKTSSTKFKTVHGTWVVPQGDCSSGEGYSATWVGIGGYKSSSQALEQTGTEFDCSANGTPTYSAWYELVPSPGHDIKMTIRPGDTMDAAVTVNGSHVTLYLRNRTLGSVFRRTFNVKAPDTSSAEWIVEAPSSCNGAGQCSQLPLSNFGTSSITGASATTSSRARGSISGSRWRWTKVTMSQAGERRFARYATVRGAAPSALSAAGSAFSVAYTEAPPSDAQPKTLTQGTGGG